MNQTPEQRAIVEHTAQRAQYDEAKVIGLETVTELQPVSFGEVVGVIKKRGISEHLASQALDAMTGRQIDTTPVGKLVLK